MLTMDDLRRFGADTEDGLKRCMNNETMYLRLITMALGDSSFEKLSTAVADGDKKAAFEAVHAIKGMMGNLSLTPLYNVVSEMTELLREGKDADYEDLAGQILSMREELLTLQNS